MNLSAIKVLAIGDTAFRLIDIAEFRGLALLKISLEKFGYPVTVPSAQSAAGKRILIATFGSLGDLHPYMALGIALRQQGHRVTIATLGTYREKIESVGLGFAAIRPDLTDFGDDPDLIKKAMDLKSGTQFLLEKMILPHIEAGYGDLWTASEHVDFMISHPATFAVPIVAVKRRIPWAASSLAPMTMASAYDPPLIAAAPWLRIIQSMGPLANKVLLALFRMQTRRWLAPVTRLREKNGVTGLGHPFFEGQFSPLLNLALFSPLFGPVQPDWPAHTVVTGFPFLHADPEALPLDSSLERFLAAGPPPVIFTLGSTAVMTPGQFYDIAIAASRRIRRRAVLLAGPAAEHLQTVAGDDLFVTPYAPHAAIFRRAAAVVHQGGVGTTAEALRSGRPMLIIPFSHDQPDNARRVKRLGCGLILERAKFSPISAAERLQQLLNTPEISARAARTGAAISREHGIAAACQAVREAIDRACR